MHANTFKMIVQHLMGTVDKGMIMKPNNMLNLENWCDANFPGLYKIDPDSYPTSIKSWGTFMITVSEDVPLFSKTQLHSEITLSTTEAKYSMFSMSLQTQLPICDLLLEVN